MFGLIESINTIANTFLTGSQLFDAFTNKEHNQSVEQSIAEVREDIKKLAEGLCYVPHQGLTDHSLPRPVNIN